MSNLFAIPEPHIVSVKNLCEVWKIIPPYSRHGLQVVT